MSARFTLEQAAWSAGARVVSPGGPFAGVFTDSRAPVKGGLFVALRGEKFDGTNFVAQAAICERSHSIKRWPGINKPSTEIRISRLRSRASLNVVCSVIGSLKTSLTPN